MPIITVEVVTDSAHPHEGNLAQALADAVGQALKSPPGQTWVRCRSLKRDEYAENEVHVDAAELPVFVTVLKRQPPVGEMHKAEVAALTHAIAEAIGRPVERVHIEYAPAAVGRVSFGGKLVQ